MSVNEVKLKKAPEAFTMRGTSGPPSSRTFCLGDEDHTLGNSLRHILMRDSAVSFAGYSVPHPSEPIVQIRVQTSKKKQQGDDQGEGEEPPAAIDRFKVACKTLHSQCGIVLEKWESVLPEVKEDKIRMDELLLEEMYEQGDGGDEQMEVVEENAEDQR